MSQFEQVLKEDLDKPTAKRLSGLLGLRLLDHLAEHGRLEVPNFGILKVIERKARLARNPKTGEVIQVPAKKTVIFRLTPKAEAAL